MKKLLTTIAAISTISSFGFAHAENFNGGDWYVSVNAIWAFVPDSDASYQFTGTNSPSRSEKAAEWDGGFGIAAAVGYDLFQGNNFRTRADVELAYRKLGLEENSVPFGIDIGSGDTFTLMANGYVEFPLQQTGITPYIGLGAGMAFVDIGGAKGTDTVFAWKAIAGLGYSLSEYTEVFAEYNYLVLDDIEYSAKASGDFGISLGDRGNFLQHRSHNVAAGVRFRF